MINCGIRKIYFCGGFNSRNLMLSPLESVGNIFSVIHSFLCGFI